MFDDKTILIRTTKSKENGVTEYIERYYICSGFITKSRKPGKDSVCWVGRSIDRSLGPIQFSTSQSFFLTSSIMQITSSFFRLICTNCLRFRGQRLEAKSHDTINVVGGGGLQIGRTLQLGVLLGALDQGVVLVDDEGNRATSINQYKYCRFILVVCT